MSTLFVDDESELLMLAEEFFAMAKIPIITSSTSNEAKEIIKKENIDLLFTDLNLDDGNGAELCKLVTEKNPNARIYIISGSHEAHIKEQFEVPENTKFLPKPFEIDQLIKIAKS